jgi:RND family efflux transporter MFP subunit
VPAHPAPSENEGVLSVLSVENEVDVYPLRDGVVVEIIREEGNAVEAGALLARLDDRELQAMLDRARASLEVAVKNVVYNEAELKARQAAYRRAQEMRRLGLNSEADLEEAEFRAKGAEADLDSAHAVVQRTQADIRLLELELEKSRIRAPFRGLVTRRYIRVGQTVHKDDKDDRCFRVSALAPLLVHFLVPETAAHRPRQGEPVKVALVSDSGRSYPARVTKVSPTVDPGSGSYDVTVQLTNPDLSTLRPGMSVRVMWGAPAARP